MANKTNSQALQQEARSNALSIPQLRSMFKGQVISSGDPDYDQGAYRFLWRDRSPPCGDYPGQGCG